jgi:hypothetical protein
MTILNIISSVLKTVATARARSSPFSNADTKLLKDHISKLAKSRQLQDPSLSSKQAESKMNDQRFLLMEVANNLRDKKAAPTNVLRLMTGSLAFEWVCEHPELLGAPRVELDNTGPVVYTLESRVSTELVSVNDLTIGPCRAVQCHDCQDHLTLQKPVWVHDGEPPSEILALVYETITMTLDFTGSLKYNYAAVGSVDVYSTFYEVAALGLWIPGHDFAVMPVLDYGGPVVWTHIDSNTRQWPPIQSTTQTLAKKGAIVKSVLLRRRTSHDSWTTTFPPTEITHSTPIIIGKGAIVLITSPTDDTVLLDEWKIDDDNFCLFKTNFCLGGARCDCRSIDGDNHCLVLLRLYSGNGEAKLTKYNLKRKVCDRQRELQILKTDEVNSGEGQNVMMEDPYSADSYYVDIVDNKAPPDESQTYRFRTCGGCRYILAVARLQLYDINQGMHSYKVDSFTRVPKSISNPMGTEEVFYREKKLTNTGSGRGNTTGLPAGRVMLETITPEEHQDAAIHLLRDPSISSGATVVGPTVQ